MSVATQTIATKPNIVPSLREDRLVSMLRGVGTHLTHYGLVLVFLWIGGMKFTNYEAEGIRPFVENSPLMSWLYQIFSVSQFAAILGVVEIAVGLLIATRPVWPRVSVYGSLAAATMFVGTLSFIVTTPGWEPSLGFPALSVPGQFLLKDAVLLGASIWTAAETWQAALRQDKGSQS
jgi:reactive chlorine resistance protein C